jgi:mannose-6-phosphate isomerase-like protein (cupin superfamily)
MRRIDKPWGHEMIWARTDRYVGKILHIRAGEMLSLQLHRVKDETILVQSGQLRLVYQPVGHARTEITLSRGDEFHIPPNMIHRMIAVGDTTVIEVSTPELEDIVRLEDAYGRDVETAR